MKHKFLQKIYTMIYIYQKFAGKLMKNFFVALISLLIVPNSISAQTEIFPCPNFELVEPSGLTLVGDSMTFSVKTADKIDLSKLSYIWTISAGYVVGGQNSATLKVVTTPEFSGANVKVAVVIKGLPEKCPNEFTEIGTIERIIDIHPHDEYGVISKNEEFTRLDSFMSSLQNNPTATGYIILYIDEKKTIKEARKHVRKIIRHIEFRKFDKSRLTFVIKKQTYYSTQLHILPEKASFPECQNCVVIKGKDAR